MSRGEVSLLLKLRSQLTGPRGDDSRTPMLRLDDDQGCRDRTANVTAKDTITVERRRARGGVGGMVAPSAGEQVPTAKVNDST